jgi:hypothetical protein
MLILFFIG